MLRMTFKIISLFIVFNILCLPFGHSQTTNLSGSLNYPTTSVTSSTSSSVDVTSIFGLNVGDTVLVIQMKGAVIDTTNSAAFGTLTNVSNAGNYEFATICNVSGQTVSFESALENSYSPTTGAVQLIRVLNYTNVDVTGTLTAPGWDGSSRTGGVLVFAASGSVTLNADINMDSKGFNGGWAQSDYTACGCGCLANQEYLDYYYATGSCRGAGKGEGITDSIIGKEFGRGNIANGGGGGNDHNAGGGGGSNYGAGGIGGNTTPNNCFLGDYCIGNNPGIGGLDLSTYYGAVNKIFLGGGGGAGHANNFLPTDGQSGGGIIIILANSLDAQTSTISARGTDMTGYNDGDGAGAGGAGGSVLLNVTTITNSAFTVNVSGGKGGDIDAFNATNCKGPGGGGGGGVVWSSSMIPAAATTSLSGGVSGVQTGPNCNGQTMGATAGGNGAAITGLNISIGNAGGAATVDSLVACNSYTWINGTTYTASNNTDTYPLTNMFGCDSIISLDLTIYHTTSVTDVIDTCGSITWIDGNTYSSNNNIATWTLPNVAGCDSIITLDLTIGSASSGVDTQTACGSYMWIDGNTYSNSTNSPTWTLTNSSGCDSIVTLNLTIDSAPDNSVTQAGTLLTINQSGATYQWLDCDANYTIISGETSQYYTPSITGNYAVEITLSGCSDTSACFLVDYNELHELYKNVLSVHPNPASNVITIVGVEEVQGLIQIDIISETGELVQMVKDSHNEIDVSGLAPGVYFIKLVHENGTEAIRFIRQ